MFERISTYLIILLSFSVYQCFGQNSSHVKGMVRDSLGTAIGGANLQIISEGDTIITSTKPNGEFNFSTNNTNFLLRITFVGYEDYRRSYNLARGVTETTLEPIILNVSNKSLAEIKIVSNAPPVVFKRDTIEYNVGSFAVSKEALVQELFKILPGLEVDRYGNVTSEGKQITQLKVNGEVFFTGNVQEFIQQLPVGIFNKVQVINDYGEQAAFTGVKKGEASKVINLVTKPGMNKGAFGNASINTGTNKIIGALLSGNFWRETKQLSASADLKDASKAIGSNVYNKATATYRDRLGTKIKFGSSYNFNGSRASAENNTFSETINELGRIDNAVNSTVFINNASHAGNINAKYEPNKRTYLKFNIDLSTNNGRDTSSAFSRQRGLIVQDLLSRSNGRSTNPGGAIEFSGGNRFKKQGRVFSFNIQYRFRKNESQNLTDRHLEYYDGNGSSLKDSIFNSFILNNRRSRNFSAVIAFIEPLSSHSSIDFNYEFNQNRQISSLITNSELSGTYIKIDSLSGDSWSDNNDNKLDVNYRYNGAKITATGGVSLQRNSVSGSYNGSATVIGQRVYNYSPILSANYSPTSTNNIELRYNGYSRSPTIEELQPVSDVTNVQQIVFGNPNLKPSFTHQLELNWRHYQPKTNQTLFLKIAGTATRNEIINNAFVLPDTLGSLRQVTTFINANGSNSISADYSYNIPSRIFSNKALNTSLAGSSELTRQVVYVNNKQSYNISRSFSQSVKTSLKLKYSETEITASYNTAFNKYIIGQGLTNSISRLVLSLTESLSLFPNNTISIDAAKNIITGYSNIGPGNPLIINANVAQTILKGKLSLQLTGADLLNQANRLSQTISGNNIITNKATYISRYFILTASFRLRKFAK